MEREEKEEGSGVHGKCGVRHTTLFNNKKNKISEHYFEKRRCSDLFVISIADNVHFLTNECMREIKFGHVAIRGLWAD